VHTSTRTLSLALVLASPLALAAPPAPTSRRVHHHPKPLAGHPLATVATGSGVPIAVAAPSLPGDRRGQLVIQSEPAGAKLTVDAEPAGVAPLVRRQLLPGDHLVEAAWPDGRRTTAIARVGAGTSSVVVLDAGPHAAAAVVATAANEDDADVPDEEEAERPRHSTFILIKGDAANEDKHRRCLRVATEHGWALDKTAPVQGMLVLNRKKNELIVTSSDHQVLQRDLAQDPMEDLCAETLQWISRTIEAPPAKAAAPSTTTPVAAPSTAIPPAPANKTISPLPPDKK
jgi:hypothetical protein